MASTRCVAERGVGDVAHRRLQRVARVDALVGDVPQTTIDGDIIASGRERDHGGCFAASLKFQPLQIGLARQRHSGIPADALNQIEYATGRAAAVQRIGKKHQ